MRTFRLLTVVLTALLALVSCSRDPNVAKKRYVESGNKFFERGKYKEAVIMYKDALQKDMRYGPAYYRLAMAQMKLGQLGLAVQALRRSIELNDPKDPASADAHWDSVVKMTEILVAAAKDARLQGEAEQYIKDILAHDPNSWDGHRLRGDLAFLRAVNAFKISEKEESKRQIDAAVADYRQAETIKPNQQGVQMQLAHALYVKGQYPEAEQLYLKIIERDKTYQYAYTDLYRLYVGQNRMDDGEKILKEAIQNNPKQYAFLTALAMHYSMLRRGDDMVKVLQQIKSHSKDFEQAYIVVGDFYARLGDSDSAIREFREGMEKDVKKKALYQKKVIEVLMRQGKRNEAADVMRQILKDNPQDNDAKGLEGMFLLEKGDVNQALTELQGVVARASDKNAVARYNLGRAYAARGEYELARQMFQKAIDIAPDYIAASLALGQLEISRGEFDAALKTAAHILTVDRNSVNARLIQSAALMGQKKLAEAHQLLDSMLMVNPNLPDVQFQLGIVNLAENKFKEAEQAFRKSYDLNPANPRGLMGMVETLMAQKQPDEAMNLLRGESAKAPQRMDIVLMMGTVAVRTGKFDDAIGHYQHVLDSLDKNAKSRGDMLMRIGDTYRRKGDLQNAAATMQKAREIQPNNVMILTTLAMVLEQGGRWTEAQQVYQAAVKMDPNNGLSLNNLAFLMAEHGGDLNSALNMANKAKQIMPNLTEVTDTLGWIYLKKGMPDIAIESFRELVAKAPHQATYRYHLGMALLQKGDRPSALREFQNALKDNPKKEERDDMQEKIQKMG
jgi:tetratricopeptide (TPR) repeat protein